MYFENHYIIKESPKLIQRLVLDHAKGNWCKYFVGGLIFFLFKSWIPDIISVLYPESYWDYAGERFQGLNEAAVNFLKNVSVSALFYLFLLVGVFQVGKALYVLTFIRNKKCEYRSLFEGFSCFLKSMCMAAAQSLFITVGFMFFIVPGILFFYHFRLAYFILADDPRKGIMQCLAESRFRMSGNKLSMLRLDISYLAYIMIGYLPSYLVVRLGYVDATTYLGLGIYLLLEIPLAIALAYATLGQAVFYELSVQGGFDHFKYAGQDAFRNHHKYSY